MSQTTHMALKVIFIVHLVLSAWARIAFLSEAYTYINAFVLAFAVWAIVCPESIDAIHMFFILNLISIPMDMIFIGVYADRGAYSGPKTSDYRFSLGMSILNLIIKPITCFLLYKLYQDRTGVFSFPQFPAFSGSQRGYDTIDEPVYQSGGVHVVETASPHSQVGPRAEK